MTHAFQSGFPRKEFESIDPLALPLSGWDVVALVLSQVAGQPVPPLLVWCLDPGKGGTAGTPLNKTGRASGPGNVLYLG